MAKRGKPFCELSLKARSLPVDDAAWLDVKTKCELSMVRKALEGVGGKASASALCKGGWRVWRVA